MMLTRLLGVATAVLAALVVHQYSQIEQLRAAVAQAQSQGTEEARADLIRSIEAQVADVQRATSWLNDYYKSADGLQRPQGLWIDGHPDFEGIIGWIYGVYLPHRLRGEDDARARQAIVDVIRQSEEWRVKHRT